MSFGTASVVERTERELVDFVGGVIFFFFFFSFLFVRFFSFCLFVLLFSYSCFLCLWLSFSIRFFLGFSAEFLHAAHACIRQLA